MDLSIIVPIYNTENEKLIRCLKSLTKFKNISFEVLMINDGSLSYIETICAKFTKNNSNFNYLWKENGGVSSARNYGLKCAQGEYVLFVDADDFIWADKIEKSYLRGDFIIFDTLKKNHVKQPIFKNNYTGKIEKIELVKAVTTTDLLNGIAGKIIKKKSFSELKLNENLVTGEDLDFVIRIIKKSKYVLYIKEYMYMYEYDSKSAKKRLTEQPYKFLMSIMKNYKDRLKLIDMYLCNEKHKRNFVRKTNNIFMNKIVGFMYSLYLEKIDGKLFKRIIYSVCITINWNELCVFSKEFLIWNLIINKKWDFLVCLFKYRKIVMGD
ncbi:glycosyltransferase family 2 protein [Lactobacillus sp. UCMA15818]|uniref:glycosyltransferase family 2 protein n=1 Tax=Lactobacillus sp. UCMA15818 TaxID=2583394 RepID=UPI0025B129CF|nr:glycosyltransferase family 2 protein [Lactobacillus sp. UCMA15818]MDN2452992.1 glycosyltransferase [Lactobacillus sp. UCMA15818]